MIMVSKIKVTDLDPILFMISFPRNGRRRSWIVNFMKDGK